MKPIPTAAIFVERDGAVFYVTNWQQRRTTPTPAKILKLSPRHLQRYRHMKAKGRSPKSTYYYVFGKVRRIAKTITLISVPIGLLRSEQLQELIAWRLGKPSADLRDMSITDLRTLYLALIPQ